MAISLLFAMKEFSGPQTLSTHTHFRTTLFTFLLICTNSATVANLHYFCYCLIPHHCYLHYFLCIYIVILIVVVVIVNCFFIKFCSIQFSCLVSSQFTSSYSLVTVALLFISAALSLRGWQFQLGFMLKLRQYNSKTW